MLERGVINILVLVGGSASGKSTIEKELVKNHGYQKVISYTTRLPRQGEIDGIDYHFITDEKFAELKSKNFFVEVGVYRGWYYGSSVSDYRKDKMVAVLTPHGLRQVQKMKGLDIVSFYIDIPRRDRLIKMLQRGDDIDECTRRSLNDQGMFDGLNDDVDYTIHNDGYRNTKEEIANGIVKIVNGHKESEVMSYEV